MKCSIKRILALLTSVTMLAATLVACTPKEAPVASDGKTDTKTETPAGKTTEGPGGLTWPLTPEKTEFSILSHVTPPEGPGAWADPNEIPFYKEYEEKTNVHINWETVTYDAFVERMNILIAGGDTPDAFLKGKITDSDLIKNGAGGTFVNLKDMIPKYAPNLNKILTDYDGAKYITLNDGIWGTPYILESESIRIDKIYMNEKWLKNVGKEMPTTTDEFLDVLRAFRDKDANGNGDTKDEIPYGAGDIASVITTFFGAFGLENRGSSTPFVDADPANPKKVRFYRGADEMKDLLKLVKTMYDEKLINPNIFTTDAGTAFFTDVEQDVIGSHMYWATVVGPKLVDTFQPLPAALKGPKGVQTWGSVGGMFSGKGSFVITNTCKKPETLLSWVDYFYSEEGAANYLLGTEGVSYTKAADGTLAQTELITNNPDGLSQEQALIRYSLASGGRNPSIATDNTFKGGETYPTSIKGTANFKPYTPKEIWFAFPWTAEQSAVIAKVQPDIQSVVDEYEAGFISGKKDIEKDWAKYQEVLKTAGVDQYIATYEEALANLSK